MIEHVKGVVGTMAVVGAAVGAAGAEVQGLSITATVAIAVVSGIVSATAAVVGTRSSARGAHLRISELETRTNVAIEREREDRVKGDDVIGARLSRIDAHLDQSGRTLSGINELLARMDEREKLRERLLQNGRGTRQGDAS